MTLSNAAREIAAFYDQALKRPFAARLPPIVEGATYSHYVIRVQEPDRLVAKALRRSVELGRVIDYCVPDMPVYRSIARDQGPFNETRLLSQFVVNVPIWVDKARANRVAEILAEINDGDDGA